MDVSFVDGVVAAVLESENVVGSIRFAAAPLWEGLTKLLA